MKLTERPAPGDKVLIIEAENEYDGSILHEFARNKEPLTATIEHDNSYTYPHLLIKKEKS